MLIPKILCGLGIMAMVPLAAAGLAAPATQAAGAGTLAKPTKPPAPTATPAAPAQGVVYYKGPGTAGLWFINADGTGATQTDPGVEWTPSRVQHGGKRWLLDYYADPAETYPNGRPRGKLVVFGVDANGDAVATVEFLVPADLELNGQALAKWLDDPNTGTPDGLVTWPARRWDLGASPPVVVEAGIYTAEVAFDGTSGDVTGIVAGSVSLAVPFALSPAGSGGQGECYTVGGGWFADVWQVAWRPNGSQVVYTRCTDSQLMRSSVPGSPGAHASLGDSGVSPDWTRGATARVVYQGDQTTHGFQSIRTIDPNAANPASTVATIVAGQTRGQNAHRNERPFWSPTGSHIAFGRGFIDAGGIPWTADLLYVPASGGTVTLLDTLGHHPTGWVEAPTP